LKVRIDKEDDALYFESVEVEIVESEEASPGVIMDCDAQGQLVGIEILELSKRSTPDKRRRRQFETT